ncbi:MAG: tetratricopeptide repeat protein [Steroidobacteraceae bacterium]
MRPAAVLLVLLSAASASCAMRPAAYSGADRRSASSEQALAAGRQDPRPMSSSVIGPENALLAQGAHALQAGRAAEGVRLTLEGLEQPTPVHDIAAAHANLCAGYVLLGRYDEALTQCNLSIQLDPANWRAYNNRAAVFAAKGWYELAAADIETGLKIAPNSAVLLKSLAIIHRDQRLLRQHRRSAADA